jgi:hypothetical protein
MARIPAAIKKLHDTVFDENKMLDSFAESGMRHYRLHQKWILSSGGLMDPVRVKVQITNGYISKRIQKNWTLQPWNERSNIFKDPDQTEEALRAFNKQTDALIQRLDAIVARGYRTLSDRFYFAEKSINLPHLEERSARMPSEVICLDINGENLIHKIGWQPFSR